MSEDYWEGGTYVIQGTVETDGATAGEASLTVTPGAGNEFEVLYGMVGHDDATTRTTQSLIRDDGDRGLMFYNTEGFANTEHEIPNNRGSRIVGKPTRGFVSGAMDVFSRVAAMGVNQKATFALVLRLRGGIPTVAFAGPSGATLTTNTKRVE